MPFLCVITPIFDGCYDGFCDLVRAVQQQSFDDYMHIAISDGPSPRIQCFIEELGDTRVVYAETPATHPQDRMSRFLSVVGRRDYALRNWGATRYLFLDADIQLLSQDVFKTLHQYHQIYSEKLIMPKVLRSVSKTFPGFPICCGQLDIANLCITHPMAQEGYPVDYDPRYPYANDYRLFKNLEYRYGYQVVDFIATRKEGNKKYKNLREFA